MTRTRPLRGLWLLPLLWLAGGAQADADNVVYRCEDASGAVTFQNGTPCAKGMRQQRRVVEIAAPLPAFVPPPQADVAPSVPLISTLRLAELGTGDVDEDAPPREPPPPLFACRVYDDSSYYREDDTPPTRCRPLQTVGIGSVPGMGAGQACEHVEDVCTAVPADSLCRVWETRVREAEFRWQYAQGRERERLRQEYEALFTTYSDSDCLGH
ncbi:DUF4124 domain-containing protein [Luteimonas sp. BDR2-5]|uniref:DUF4124 domain-containing protein n=1 Tax=Proluteimonas luteida TaxID=2878685 RepID=UPI001E521E81|nr:DUF4124 domain-containing protein [Luteimonas sp. BDR2-5]MCD9027342.1 DUF4124 domain-containing protein [Luteimonas sp. BDR2-5]